MDEASPAASVSSITLQEFAVDGQKHLEATVEAAHEILSSTNEVLCNPALWVTAPSSQASQAAAPGNADGNVKVEGRGGAESVAELEAGWAALDEARLRYRSSTTALRVVITAIFSSPQMKQDVEFASSAAEKADSVETERLEQRVSELREEIGKKNQALKLLIDQLRELISDISMWQSSNP